jgi:hypothetical protein
MVKLDDCWESWEVAYCSRDLHVTFSVRSNRDSAPAGVYTEFLTSDGKICGRGWAESRQPLVAGVTATFRTTTVYAYCAAPFQTVRAITRIQEFSNTSANPVPIEMTKQEVLLGYTFFTSP